MRRVLITGVTGFAGSHLVDYLLTRGDCEIFGIQRWRSRTENIEHFADKITLFLLRTTAEGGKSAAWWPQIRFPDGRYAFAFTRAGTYAYYCSLHPRMTGKIIVTER